MTRNNKEIFPKKIIKISKLVGGTNWFYFCILTNTINLSVGSHCGERGPHKLPLLLLRSFDPSYSRIGLGLVDQNSEPAKIRPLPTQNRGRRNRKISPIFSLFSFFYKIFKSHFHTFFFKKIYLSFLVLVLIYTNTIHIQLINENWTVLNDNVIKIFQNKLNQNKLML